MKGNNTIQLNEATIIDAVQEYLDKRWVGAAPRVVSVKVTATASYSSTFDVAIKEPAVNADPGIPTTVMI